MFGACWGATRQFPADKEKSCKCSFLPPGLVPAQATSTCSRNPRRDSHKSSPTPARVLITIKPDYASTAGGASRRPLGVVSKGSNGCTDSPPTDSPYAKIRPVPACGFQAPPDASSSLAPRAHSTPLMRACIIRTIKTLGGVMVRSGADS